jgi:hypothetical protein
VQVRVQAIANNSKVYFGTSIPTMFGSSLSEGKK